MLTPKSVKHALLIILRIIMLVILLFTGKLLYEVAYSPYSSSIANPDRLTVLYRPGCHRCQKVMPYVLTRTLFSVKRVYFVNADKLTAKQLKKAELNLTPGFRYKGSTVQTINHQKIKQIVDKSAF